MFLTVSPGTRACDPLMWIEIINAASVPLPVSYNALQLLTQRGTAA